jgi:hypothetical protein
MSDSKPDIRISPSDLLAQADALMRKNREPNEDDLPLLEEEVLMPEVPTAAINAETNWDVVCESVYSRVMQQLDLYSEFGLKDRIRREVRPKLNDWMDQFAVEIGVELSENIRKFVAQAIEEEVARMRAAKKNERERP